MATRSPCHQTLFAILAILFLAAAFPARAQMTTYAYDQQYTAVDGNGDGYNLDVGDTRWQSFTPTATAMDTGVFFLAVTQADGSDTVYLRLYAGTGTGGPLLGQSANVVLPTGYGLAGNNGAATLFRFPATMALTPDSPYTLALTFSSTTDSDSPPEVDIFGTAANGYAGGQDDSPGDGVADYDFQEGLGTPNLTVLHGFGGSSDGFDLRTGVIQGGDGRFYGLTLGSGDATFPVTAFALSADGQTFTDLHDFPNAGYGDLPAPTLLQANDGNLYGTGVSSTDQDPGMLYVLSTDGTAFKVLHTFGVGADGAEPIGTLIQGSDGYLYGTTTSGGANGDGTVFKISTDGTFYETLHDFGSGGSDGQNPHAGLFQANDGLLYGTTMEGGDSNGDGTVYRLAPDGTGYGIIHAFDGTDGSGPQSVLIQAGDGFLYGTAEAGSAGNNGTVFQLSTDGTTFKVLYNFGTAATTGGTDPRAGLVLGSDGNLYGAAHDDGPDRYGTVYMVSTDGQTYGVLATFDYANTGGFPEGTPIQAADGGIVGTALAGGPNEDGTVYRIGAALPDVVQFHMAINSVNETAGTATVRVDRIGGSQALSIQYSLANGTAKAGTDYSDPSGTDSLGWAPGDQTPKFIPVTILNRGFTDGSLRTLSIRIGSVASYGDGAGFGYPNRATLTIDGLIPGAPVITSAQTAMGYEGVPFSYQIVASANPTTYGFQGDPNGLTINPTTGLISGTPKAAHGPLSYTLNAFNAAGKGSAPLTITFAQAQPTITSLLTADATANAPFSYQITASGGAPQRFGVTGLPAGLSVDPASGIISGTRKVPGPVTMTLNAFNSAGEGSASLTINVAAEAVPVITSATTASATAGQPFNYTITASNNPTSFGVQSLPAGLSVDASTGVISGTRKVPGTVTLTLNAYNSSGKGSAMLTLTVSAP